MISSSKFIRHSFYGYHCESAGITIIHYFVKLLLVLKCFKTKRGKNVKHEINVSCIGVLYRFGIDFQWWQFTNWNIKFQFNIQNLTFLNICFQSFGNKVQYKWITFLFTFKHVFFLKFWIVFKTRKLLLKRCVINTL